MPLAVGVRVPCPLAGTSTLAPTLTAPDRRLPVGFVE